MKATPGVQPAKELEVRCRALPRCKVSDWAAVQAIVKNSCMSLQKHQEQVDTARPNSYVLRKVRDKLSKLRSESKRIMENCYVLRTMHEDVEDPQLPQTMGDQVTRLHLVRYAKGAQHPQV